MHHLDHKIKRDGTKKLLALDGGGIRGIMTVDILTGLEVEGFLRLTARAAAARGGAFV